MIPAPPPPGPDGPQARPHEQTSRLSSLGRAAPILLSAFSHSILVVLFLWIVYTPGRAVEELDFPVQIQVQDAIGNTDDETANELTDPGEEAVEPAEVESPVEERREPAPTETATEERSLGLGGFGKAPSPEVRQPPADLDERKVLDALDRASRLASRSAPAFRHRNRDGRAAMAGQYGGSEETEAAVERGLAWLAAHQSPDGRWDSNDFTHRCPASRRCTGRGLSSYDPAQTGLALLAFLGAGYTPREGSYASVVRGAIDFLLDTQEPSGRIGNGDLYNHSIAVFALAEACGMIQERRIRRAVQTGVRYLVRAQQPSGGWSYTAEPREERNDSSIAGFAVMALTAAESAGIRVPESALAGAIDLFRRMTDPDTGTVRYADRGPNFARQSEGLTAVGLLVRQLLGQPADDPTRIRTLLRVAQNPPRWEERASIDHSMYTWYYGTLGLFLTGGPEWEEWNREMIHCLVPHQEKHGHRAGSWEPDGKWGPNGGRLYSTSINILTLEVYYKYAPGFLEQRSNLARYWLEPRNTPK